MKLICVIWSQTVVSLGASAVMGGRGLLRCQSWSAPWLECRFVKIRWTDTYLMQWPNWTGFTLSCWGGILKSPHCKVRFRTAWFLYALTGLANHTSLKYTKVFLLKKRKMTKKCKNSISLGDILNKIPLPVMNREALGNVSSFPLQPSSSLIPTQWCHARETKWNKQRKCPHNLQNHEKWIVLTH